MNHGGGLVFHREDHGALAVPQLLEDVGRDGGGTLVSD
jgi:hypothetical protein